jgi:uncharacterized membrane protein YeaQ/YmgE (transglycosylase-associated protein family)
MTVGHTRSSAGSQALSLAESQAGSPPMKSQLGLLMNILLGVVGAAIADWLFGFLGVTFAGWIGYLISGFIGACT